MNTNEEKKELIFQVLADLKSQEKNKEEYCDFLLSVIGILLDNIDDVDYLLADIQNICNTDSQSNCCNSDNENNIIRTIHYPWKHERELPKEFVYFEVLDFLSGEKYDNDYTARF